MKIENGNNYDDESKPERERITLSNLNDISSAFVVLKGYFSEQDVDVVFSEKAKARIFLGYLKKMLRLHCTSPTSTIKYRSMKIQKTSFDPYLANRKNLDPLYYLKIRQDGLDIIELKKCEKIEEYIKYLDSEVEVYEDPKCYICHIYADNEINAVETARNMVGRILTAKKQ